MDDVKYLEIPHGLPSSNWKWAPQDEGMIDSNVYMHSGKMKFSAAGTLTTDLRSEGRWAYAVPLSELELTFPALVKHQFSFREGRKENRREGGKEVKEEGKRGEGNRDKEGKEEKNRRKRKSVTLGGSDFMTYKISNWADCGLHCKGDSGWKEKSMSLRETCLHLHLQHGCADECWFMPLWLQNR